MKQCMKTSFQMLEIHTGPPLFPVGGTSLFSWLIPILPQRKSCGNPHKKHAFPRTKDVS